MRITATGEQSLSKVPAVTLGFWLIKILATTLGETGPSEHRAKKWTPVFRKQRCDSK